MVVQILSVTLPVADQDAALDFYVNTLGWQKAVDAPLGDGERWLTVVPPGATTQLALAAIGGIAAPVPRPESGITLMTPDIDAAYETLSARGVAFTQPVSVMPWGAKATWFADPDGNVFFLVEA